MNRIALALTFLLASCVSPNMAPLVDAMAKDQASVCLHVGATMWTPEITVARINTQGVAANCATGTLSTMPTAGQGTAIVTFPGQLTVK